MRKVVIGVMLGALGMFAWQRVMQPAPAAESADSGTYDAESLLPERPSASEQRFKCDGRTRCAEMSSCAEAKYFLEHCPGVKMDGEGDGIPCEGSLCEHRR